MMYKFAVTFKLYKKSYKNNLSDNFTSDDSNTRTIPIGNSNESDYNKAIRTGNLEAFKSKNVRLQINACNSMFSRKTNYSNGGVNVSNESVLAISNHGNSLLINMNNSCLVKK